ncbi:tape measure protein [Proteus mirabilis]|uniref:tape measure protein n=1 Tax=Proteus mirabilis TaxID=584 RepID=UPI0023F829B0|nr:tape measure protein [Proteus mirabilis]MDF7193492.1 tape measure protein [Proteus mirabilis]
MAQVGEIVYQVQMDVQQLLTSQRQLEQRLNRMDDSFNRTSQSVNNTERSMLSLSKVAASLAGYLSASMVASYSEAWTELNNKLSNSVRASESLIDVTQRVFDISQATRSSLDATATLYARLERGTREYNTSAEDLAKLTSIINQGFIVSGATAQEAENAIIQLSQGIASGVIRGEEFNSVAEQGSRLMVALADSMGVGIGQLRKMAAEGKLTTDVVVKGLLSQGDAIGKEFAKTTRTMSQAFQEAGNNLTKFLGENTTIKASINVFSDAVITASKNLDAMADVLTLTAGVIGSRFLGALSLAGAAQLKKAKDTITSTIATRNSAKAEVVAAKETLTRVQAEKAFALTTQQSLSAQLSAAQTEQQRSRIRNELSANSARIAALTRQETLETNRLAAAQARVAATSVTMAGAMRALNIATAPLGGPMGALMLAGAAMYYFYQKTEQAKQEARDFADSIDHLTAKLKELSYQEIARDAQDAKDKQELLRLEMKEQEKQLSKLRSEIELQKTALSGMPDLIDKNTTRILREVTRIEGDLAENRKKSEAITRYLVDAQEEYNRKTKEAIDLSVKNALVIFAEKTGFGDLANKIRDATNAKREFNATGADYGGEEGEKLKKQMERRLELSKREGVERAKLQALYAAQDAGIFDKKAIDELQEMAAQEYKNGQVKKESTKATDAAYEALKRQREEIELLNKGYKDGSLEMAKYDAVKALGDKASPKQIEKAEQLAEEKYNIERNLADKKAALELDLVAKAKESHDKQLADLERITKDDVSLTEQAARRKAEIEAEYQQKIAEIKANNAVSPQDDIKGKVDPVQQLKNEHERKLALIKEYENQNVLTQQQSLELMNAANTQYEQDRLNAQWEIWRNQSQANQFLADGLDALGQRSTNVLTGLLTQTQSINDAFRNVALTIVDQAVGALVQMGMQQVKNMVTESAKRKASNAQAIAEATTTGAAITNAMAPAAATTSIATMGSAATWGMAAMATAIPAMIALAGARKNGGPVNAGSMYRVGEGGKPEIFKASNGSQYMIPGDNGRVISNRQMGKGGNGVSMGDMNFTFQVQAPNGITQKEAQQIQQMVRGTVYDVLGNEMRSGGALEKVRSW